jgi:hypothetical protein
LKYQTCDQQIRPEYCVANVLNKHTTSTVTRYFDTYNIAMLYNTHCEISRQQHNLKFTFATTSNYTHSWPHDGLEIVKTETRTLSAASNSDKKFFSPRCGNIQTKSLGCYPTSCNTSPKRLIRMTCHHGVAIAHVAIIPTCHGIIFALFSCSRSEPRKRRSNVYRGRLIDNYQNKR